MFESVQQGKFGRGRGGRVILWRTRWKTLNLEIRCPKLLPRPALAAAKPAGRGFCSGRRVDCSHCCCWPPARACCGCARRLWRRCRSLDGDLHLAGLSAPVTVRRDGHGVPHIEAASESDLFTAQGYVTAQDRLWQMDALRRNANGELAEVMGSSLVRARHGAAGVADPQYGAAHLRKSARRRPRPLRGLCARRESLHRAASRMRCRRSSGCCTTDRSLDRRGFGQPSA